MSATLELYADVRRRFPPSKQMLPSAVNNALTAWWLALIFTLVGFAAFWPMLAGGLARMLGMEFLIDKNTQTLTREAWYLLAGFAAAMIAFGIFFTIGVMKKSRLVLNSFRVSFVIGLLFGLAVDGLLISVLTADSSGPKAPVRPGGGPAAVSVAPAAPPMGPTPTLGWMLVTITTLTPIFFGVLGLIQAGSKGVREYFETTDATALEDLLRPAETGAAETAVEEQAHAEAESEAHAEAGAESRAEVEEPAAEIAPTSREAAAELAAQDPELREAATALDAVLTEEGLDLDAQPTTPPDLEAVAALDAVLAEEGIDARDVASPEEAEVAEEAEIVEEAVVAEEVVEAEVAEEAGEAVEDKAVDADEVIEAEVDEAGDADERPERHE